MDAQLSLMTGFPAKTENQVDLSNWRTAPYCHWAFHHVRELLPTANVEADHKNLNDFSFSSDHQPVDKISFNTADGTLSTVADVLDQGSTDAFMVLKDDRIVFEQYYNDQQAHEPHVIFSVTKSVTGILTGILAHEGIIDPDAPAISYMPQASHTAWKDCSLQHILDMSVGIEFNEDYVDLAGDVARYRRSTGWDPIDPQEADMDLRQYLLTLKPNQQTHGETFHYVSPNTDFLGWMLENVTQKSWAKLVSEYIWQPMGATHDAYMTVDKFGAPRAAGGFCISISDMARFAYMVMNNGRIGDRQIVSPEWLNDIHHNGNQKAWLKGEFSELLPMGNYRNFWYQTGYENNAFCAIGIHGQWIYCNPKDQVVIVRQSSQGQAVDEPYDLGFLSACLAISNYLS